jgi:hypothetical protein
LQPQYPGTPGGQVPDLASSVPLAFSRLHLDLKIPLVNRYPERDGVARIGWRWQRRDRGWTGCPRRLVHDDLDGGNASVVGCVVAVAAEQQPIAEALQQSLGSFLTGAACGLASMSSLSVHCSATQRGGSSVSTGEPGIPDGAETGQWECDRHALARSQPAVRE